MEEPSPKNTLGTVPPPELDVEHAVGCAANDLDPLDHTPCACGLRLKFNPWGRDDAQEADRG